MKKLTKINLHGAQIMNDAQLKHILGGGDGGGEYPEGYHPDPAVRACTAIGVPPGDLNGQECALMAGGTLRRGTCQFTGNEFELACII